MGFQTQTCRGTMQIAWVSDGWVLQQMEARFGGLFLPDASSFKNPLQSTRNTACKTFDVRK